MLQVNWNGTPTKLVSNLLQVTKTYSRTVQKILGTHQRRPCKVISTDMTKLEKNKSPKMCPESCSCKITGATTISCVFFFSAFFGCFRFFNNDQTSKRGPTLRMLKASKACSSSAFPCGVVDSGERKKKRRKNWRSVGRFYCESPSCCCESSFFHETPNLFWFFCVVKQKRFNIPTRQQKKRRKPVINYLPPIPPKHTLLENWWRPLLWCFFEWHLDTCKVRDQQPLVVLKQRYTSISQGYMAKIW